jgi:nucleoside-diphosphate-sugar epimerase
LKVSILGTNGFLSESIGKYCNDNKLSLFAYGRRSPVNHEFDSFTFIDFNISNVDIYSLLDSDIIFYLVGAGIQSNHKDDKNLIYNLNTFTPIRITNELSLKGYKGTFISFGSYFEIGENYIDHCYTEIEVLHSIKKTVNDYSVSKRIFSRYINSIDLPFTSLHFILPTIYGEKESRHRVIPYTIDAIKTGTNVAYTSGNQVRQYIYIDEVVDMIFRAYRCRLSSRIYNISGVETFTVKELVNLLFSLHGKKIDESKFGLTSRKDIGMYNLQLNGEKLQKEINYHPYIKVIDVYERY